jgi:hypothetical protein
MPFETLGEAARFLGREGRVERGHRVRERLSCTNTIFTAPGK